ncbi:MAG TPA: SDR family oxidoreductase [Nitrolancea sp.]|nr:SDR family oxidoreductase [Nitrolancea sp.]
MRESSDPGVVVVTGARAGVGRATVRSFARRGARIGLVARGRDELEIVRQEVESEGGKGLVLPTDIADATQVEAAAAAVEETFGPIDLWINNAMVTVFSPVREMEPEEYLRVTEVTYLGYVYGTLAALKRMHPRDRGMIVQVGSALVYRSIPLQSAYCGAKAAVRGFTDSLRTELIHDGSHVRVTMVQLPALNTPQFEWNKTRMPRKAQPVPPIFQPEVAAKAIVWASEHNRRELNVGWSTVAAIYGQKFIPGLMDYYLGRTGYDAQQYDGPPSPDRRDNLWDAVPGNFGAHGSFDSRSREHSSQFWVTTHRNWLALVGGGIAGATVAFLRSR